MCLFSFSVGVETPPREETRYQNNNVLIKIKQLNVYNSYYGT